MNTILQKDLRENFKLALIGLVIFSLILVMGYQKCVSFLDSFLLNNVGASVTTLDPLLSDGSVMLATFFCAIYAALLGWLQTRNEAHRDLWAFLIHRPLTRTRIFQGKALAGMILYVLGAGLPLLVLMIVSITPGNIPVPFEWPMVLPLTAVFLTGFAYYFAGMLTGMRQARWYGSRCFGLGGAILASIITLTCVEFWQALLATGIATFILALAAWGAYQSGGFHRGQPRPGQASLGIAMAAGGGILLLVVVGLTTVLLFDRMEDRFAPSPQYVLLVTGQICKATWQDGEWKSVVSLDGKPILDPQTGKPPLARRDLDRLRASGTSVTAKSNLNTRYYDNYRRAMRFFTLWNLVDKKLWYVDRHGKLIGYDGMTRQRISVLAPPDAGPDGGVAKFLPPQSNYSPDFFYRNPGGETPNILATTTSLYQIDLQIPTAERIFTADTNEEIEGFASVNGQEQIVVTTRKTIQLLATNGASLFKTPYVPSMDEFPGVTVYSLNDGEKLVLWFEPRNFKTPAHVFLPGAGGQTNQSLDLPSLFKPYPEPLWNQITESFVPPGVLLGAFLAYYRGFQEFYRNISHFAFLLSCGWSVACVFIGLGMMRRYHFSSGTKMIWSVFVLLLGIPGLIALFVTEEWPVRELCPKCQRLRAVDREHCEYCDAEFPAPEKNGTEIFEPLGAVSK